MLKAHMTEKWKRIIINRWDMNSEESYIGGKSSFKKEMIFSNHKRCTIKCGGWFSVPIIWIGIRNASSASQYMSNIWNFYDLLR